jgi:hypothetical protein
MIGEVVHAWLLLSLEESMQTYLFIGGTQDGLNIPVADNMDAIELPAGVASSEAYIRNSLSVGRTSVAVYRHESLTSKQVLDRLVEHYRPWAVHLPGSRL